MAVIRSSEVTCDGVKYVPLQDHEIAYEKSIFHLSGGRMRSITNSTYFGLTGLEAKTYQARNGVDFPIYRKFNASLVSHRIDAVPLSIYHYAEYYEEPRLVLKNRAKIDPDLWGMYAEKWLKTNRQIDEPFESSMVL